MPVSQRRARTLGRLRQRKTREREGLVLVEGVRAAKEALDASAGVRFAVVSPRLRDTSDGSALLTRLHALTVDVDEVSDGELARLGDTEHPQGVLLACAEPAAPAGAVAVPGGRYLLLDGLQDPGNAGTLVRAAVAFGLDGVIALDGTVDLWGTKAVRASAGMAFRLPVLHLTADEALAGLAAAGVPLFVADVDGEDVGAWTPTPGWALAVGNEGWGVRDAARTSAAGVLRVPMPGPAESLNAGMAGGVLLYAMTRTDHT